MKELSIEEKAKRYDNLLVKLQKAKVDNNVCDERYCCVIDNIVPELKESEGERIRKTLIAVVNLYYGEGEDEEKTACLYWLEKQKKEEPSIADIVDEHFWEMLGNEKQGEQNLVKIPKFKSGDTIEFNGLGHNRYTIKEVCGTSQYINSNGGRMDMSYTDANFKLVEQKPTEWSEEDEKTIVKMRDFFIRVLGDKPDFTEDKRYEEFIEFIDNRLKSLSPQTHWKPSREQMKFLWKYAEQNNYDGRILTLLYNDLKKL